MAKSNSKHKANKKSKIREIHYNKIVTAIAFVIVLIFLAKFTVFSEIIFYYISFCGILSLEIVCACQPCLFRFTRR